MFQYPPAKSWENDLARLAFGVEIEVFLYRDERPAMRSDVDQLFSRMMRHGFKPLAYDCYDRMMSVWQQSRMGPIALKIDYCSHLVEWSFPPIVDLNGFLSLYRDYDESLSHCADDAGLRLLPDAVLTHVPARLCFVPAAGDKNGERLRRLNERVVELGPFGHRYCFAAMAAAQVHFNILDDQFFPRLPMLYQLEYLVPLLLSNGRRFCDREAHCVRPLMYRDSFAPSYLACGVPQDVPSTANGYRSMVASGAGLFRDYSFIAPSRHGTVEFRAACSQNSVDRLMELIALRIGILWAARQGRILPRDREDVRAMFYETCETGIPPQGVLEQDMETLRSVADELPDAASKGLKSLLGRMEPRTVAHACGGEPLL